MHWGMMKLKDRLAEYLPVGSFSKMMPQDTLAECETTLNL